MATYNEFHGLVQDFTGGTSTIGNNLVPSTKAVELVTAKYSTMPNATTLANSLKNPVNYIAQYTGTTNTNYRQGYFYKLVTDTSTPSTTITSRTEGLLVTVNSATFAAKVVTKGNYTFTYNGTNWLLNETEVDLAEYGITVTSEPEADNYFTVKLAFNSTYKWQVITLQDAVQFSDLAGSPYDNTNLKNALDQKIDHFTTLPSASLGYVGKIVEYIGATTTKYTQGYFYTIKTTTHPESINISLKLGTGVYNNLTVDLATFKAKEKPTSTGTYNYVYSATDTTWKDGKAEAVVLSECGISYDNEGTVEVDNDTLQVKYYAQQPDTYEWQQINVQPEVPETVYTAGTGIDITNKQISVLYYPSTASNKNPLADQAYVNDKFLTASANFRGGWATWAAVPVVDTDYPADPTSSKTPTNNDYLVVLNASDYPVAQGETPLEGTWRFKYTGKWATIGKDGWKPEYQVEPKAFTEAQWATINSTLTARDKAQIETNRLEILKKQDKLTAGNNITIETVTEAGQTKTVISADTGSNYNFDKIEEYLYYADFDASDEDEAYAIEFFENLVHNKDTVETRAPLRFGGACSSIRKGNFYGRNYDWYYDRKKSFIIHNKPIDGRYESLGVAQSIFLDIDESNVRIIPYLMLDGINEHGLFVNNNVVPTGDMGKTTGTHPDLEGNYICMLMLPRYILDHFTTATEAVTWIQNTAKIYAPYSQTTKIELHFMIGDPNKTYIVEFINNEAVVSDVTDTNQAIMTNFYRQDADFDETTGHVDFDSVTNYGAGLERYNILADNFDSVYDMASMRDCIDKAQYTQSYTLIYVDPEAETKEVNPNCWKTEFAGDWRSSTELPVPKDLHANSPLSDYIESGVFDVVYDWYQHRDEHRDDNPAKTWQTVHSCVYDIQKRTINVKVQEENKEFYFTFPIKGGYVAGENITINENVISATGGVSEALVITDYTED